jgi:TM2 domain-containing membrane protein YozV
MGILTKSKNGFFAIPAIASAFIPGLGQLIKGHVGKGLVFLGLSIFWGVVVFIPSLIPWFGGTIVFVGTILAWLINVLDAGFNSVGQRY